MEPKDAARLKKHAPFNFFVIFTPPIDVKTQML